MGVGERQLVLCIYYVNPVYWRVRVTMTDEHI